VTNINIVLCNTNLRSSLTLQEVSTPSSPVERANNVTSPLIAHSPTSVVRRSPENPSRAVEMTSLSGSAGGISA